VYVRPGFGLKVLRLISVGVCISDESLINILTEGK